MKTKEERILERVAVTSLDEALMALVPAPTCVAGVGPGVEAVGVAEGTGAAEGAGVAALGKGVTSTSWSMRIPKTSPPSVPTKTRRSPTLKWPVSIPDTGRKLQSTSATQRHTHTHNFFVERGRLF